MNYFTIKDIENLSGIKAHTWRIWEQRHQICLPQRKESNHRFYDANNLKHILRISYLYHNGVKISRIAKMDEQQVIDLATQKTHNTDTDTFYIKELVESSFDFEPEKFEAVCSEVFDSMPADKAIINIIYPYLERVGVLWLTDHIVPAQEHFTSNIVRQKMIAAIDSLPSVPKGSLDCTILFTPEKEHHELPLLLIHYLLKRAGKKVRFFGSNIRMNPLKSYVAENNITAIHFHLITNLTSKEPDQLLQHICAAFPNQKVIMSGSQSGQIKTKPENAELLTSLEALLEYCRS